MPAALKTLCIAAVALIAFACGSPAGSGTLEVMVDPELKECVGLDPMQCMVVDGELFYSRIDGFDYEEEYVHKLKIERYDAWPNEEGPPQDASRYGYRLIETISKTPTDNS